MTPIRVGVICDLREEGWHSMDLVADMLIATLPAVAGDGIRATRICPPMIARWSRLPLMGKSSRAGLADRLTNRLWDYPRWLAPLASQFDVFHIIDHSYAHLVRVLPAERTVITCYDLDAVKPALPNGHRGLTLSRLLASHILDGLRRSALVACVSHATRNELAASRGVDPSRMVVVYAGVHPSCSPQPDAGETDVQPHAGDSTAPVILHVGSTIARKRIDVVLNVLAEVRKRVGDVRLIRVGGPLTDAQRALARSLGVLDAVTEMPFLERGELSALYRRATLVVMPSDREGFGLPVVEAMACGTPVVASAIPALQEVGGDGATYCAPGDVAEWTRTIADLLREQQEDPESWKARRCRGLTAAARFSWTSYAAEMSNVYRTLAS